MQQQPPPNSTPPPQPMNPYPYPYPYAMQIAPARVKTYPVPAGIFAPYIWGGVLIAFTIVAIVFSLIATSTSIPISLPSGTTIYNSPLSVDDNQWSTPLTPCTFTSDGLDVVLSKQKMTTTSDSGCSLQHVSVGDVALQVTLKGQDQITNTLYSSVYIHSNLRFLFYANGEYSIEENTTSGSWSRLALGFSNEWHSLGTLNNVITIIVQGTHIRLGINGTQVADATSANAATGTIGLGSFFTQTTSVGEALYGNLHIVQL